MYLGVLFSGGLYVYVWLPYVFRSLGRHGPIQIRAAYLKYVPIFLFGLATLVVFFSFWSRTGSLSDLEFHRSVLQVLSLALGMTWILALVIYGSYAAYKAVEFRNAILGEQQPPFRASVNVLLLTAALFLSVPFIQQLINALDEAKQDSAVPLNVIIWRWVRANRITAVAGIFLVFVLAFEFFPFFWDMGRHKAAMQPAAEALMGLLVQQKYDSLYDEFAKKDEFDRETWLRSLRQFEETYGIVTDFSELRFHQGGIGLYLKYRLKNEKTSQLTATFHATLTDQRGGEINTHESMSFEVSITPTRIGEFSQHVLRLALEPPDPRMTAETNW